MNKKQLAQEIATELDFDVRDIVSVLDTFENVVTENVKSGDPVMLTGFCKFARRDLGERKARNPATGETFMAPPTSKVRITALKRFKDTVMEAAPKPSRKAVVSRKSTVKSPLKRRALVRR